MMIQKKKKKQKQYQINNFTTLSIFYVKFKKKIITV